MEHHLTHNIPHQLFQLNGVHYGSTSIKDFAYNSIKEGTENESNLGQFILDWIDNSVQIELQTSGTTSKPTTILFPKEALINSAKATGVFFNLRPGNSALCCLPFSYIAAKMMFVRAWVLGLKLDIIEPSSSPLELISKPYDFSAMVPLQIHNSLSKLNQIGTLLVGGAAVSIDLAHQLKQYNCTVFETFGMTETVSHIAAKNLSESETVFRVLPNISIAQDDRGCLTVNAPHLNPKLLQTNDVVSLISNDTFKWLGRFDHVINSGGVKIHPEVLEQKLQNQIKAPFFIAGVPDEVLGQKVVLIIEGKAKQLDLDLNEMESIKRPKVTYFLPEFQRTKSGKIQRQKTLDLLNLNHA